VLLAGKALQDLDLASNVSSFPIADRELLVVPRSNSQAFNLVLGLRRLDEFQEEPLRFLFVSGAPQLFDVIDVARVVPTPNKATT
jgi:hypothetical protein